MTLTNSEILTTREAAKRMRLSTPTLERLRQAGDGPFYLKFGKAVRYRACDLDQWLETRLTRSTKEAKK